MDCINDLSRQIQNYRFVQSTKIFLNTSVGKKISIATVSIIIALGLYLFRNSWYPKLFSAKKLGDPQNDRPTPVSSTSNGISHPKSKQPIFTDDDDLIGLLSETGAKITPPKPLPRPQRNDSGTSSNGPPPKVPPRRVRQRSLSSPLSNISSQLPPETATTPTDIPPPAPPLPIPRALASSSSIASPANPAQAKHSRDIVRTTSTADMLFKHSSGMLALAEIQHSANSQNAPSSRPPSGNYDDWEIEYTAQQLTEDEREALEELRRYGASPQSDSQPNLLISSPPSSQAIDQTNKHLSSTEEINISSTPSPIAPSSPSPIAPSSPQLPQLDPRLVRILSSRRLSTQDTVVHKKTKPGSNREIPNFNQQ